MKAIVYAGGALKLEEIESPFQRTARCWVKIRAASVNPLIDVDHPQSGG
jgi:hypothetical protein